MSLSLLLWLHWPKSWHHHPQPCWLHASLLSLHPCWHWPFPPLLLQELCWSQSAPYLHPSINQKVDAAIYSLADLYIPSSLIWAVVSLPTNSVCRWYFPSTPNPPRVSLQCVQNACPLLHPFSQILAHPPSYRRLYLQCYELCQSWSIPHLHPSIDWTRHPSHLLANISISSYCCKGFIGPLPTNTDSKMLWRAAFRPNAMCPSVHLFPTGLMALGTWTLILLVTIHMICPLYLLCFYTPFVLETTQYVLVWPAWLKMTCCLLHSLMRREISAHPNLHSFTWLICFFRVWKAMPSKIKWSKAFANLLMCAKVWLDRSKGHCGWQ